MTQAKLIGGAADGMIVDIPFPHPKSIAMPVAGAPGVYGFPRIEIEDYYREPGSARWIHPYRFSDLPPWIAAQRTRIEETLSGELTDGYSVEFDTAPLLTASALDLTKIQRALAEASAANESRLTAAAIVFISYGCLSARVERNGIFLNNRDLERFTDAVKQHTAYANADPFATPSIFGIPIYTDEAHS